jgi:hypothetical protein
MLNFFSGECLPGAALGGVAARCGAAPAAGLHAAVQSARRRATAGWWHVTIEAAERRCGERRRVAAGEAWTAGSEKEGGREGEGRRRWEFGFGWDLRVVIDLHESQTLDDG